MVLNNVSLGCGVRASPMLFFFFIDKFYISHFLWFYLCRDRDRDRRDDDRSRHSSRSTRDSKSKRGDSPSEAKPIETTA